MGKSRSGRGQRGRHRVNPLGQSHAGAQDPEAAVELSPNQELIHRIEDQLKSGNANETEVGLNSLSMLVDGLASEVMEARLIRLAAPFMNDANLSDGSRLAAVGACKNLSLTSPEVCDQMVEQDIMTPLGVLLLGYQNKPEADLGQDAILLEGISLLWNLCEANETALKIFNRSQLVHFLFRCLKGSLPLALVAMQCLFTVSEDNPEVVEAIQKETSLFEALLQNDVFNHTPEGLHLRMLTVGVGFNVVPDLSALDQMGWSKFLTVLEQTLDIDQRTLVNNYTSQCPLRNGEAQVTGTEDEEAMESDVKLDKQLELKRDEINHVILAQQTGLELLANICCSIGDDEDGDWEDEDPSSGESDDVASEVVCPDGNGAIEETISLSQSLPILLVEFIQSRGILEKVLQKVTSPPVNVLEILGSELKGRYQGQGILRLLASLRSRALLCLANLVGSLGVDDLGGLEKVSSIWTDLVKLCFVVEETKDSEELLDAASTALRALTETMVEVKAAKLEALNEAELRSILEFGAECPYPKIRMNLVQIIGSIGVFCVSRGQFECVASEMVATYLVEAAVRESDLRLKAESLDKIFDMFSEDETDGLTVKLGLIPRLQELDKGLKSQILAKKKKMDAENYGIVHLASNNLKRFIKYKSKRPLVAQALSK